MTVSPLVTIGLSSHRLEVLPYSRRAMAHHAAIVLEEAPEQDFPDMLAGKLQIEDYLADKDIEFPEYSRKQTVMLRELYQEGKDIFQIEPYLERLIRIHELLAQGLTRPEVESRPGLKEVYDAEALASAALLNFYTCAHSAPFPQVVSAVKDFARADAARFRLRDDLRARAFLPLVKSFASLYVEAGYIHLFLVKSLRELLGGQARLRQVFLLAGPSLEALGRPRPMGPGDLLTLLYIFNVSLKKEKEEVLAARSLIYIKLLCKEEMAPTADHPTPHMDNEIQAYRLTADLTVKDCAALYPEVRRLPPEAAAQAVRRYLRKNRDNLKNAAKEI